MRGNAQKSMEILIVEDNSGNEGRIRNFLEGMKEGLILHVVRNEQETRAFLYKNGDFAGVPTPDLILLDLDFSKKWGRDILKEIKSNDMLKRIPVIIFSFCENETDILEGYENRANCYIIRPNEMHRFEKVMQSMFDFWIHIVTLPPQKDGNSS
ncbi:MAG: response regulator [Theionarchaea archaeon]|nr:response regulator [Theionarchaea archaeon]